MCLVCASYLFISIFFLLDQCVASVLLYLFFHYSRAGFRAVLNNSTHTHKETHTNLPFSARIFFLLFIVFRSFRTASGAVGVVFFFIIIVFNHCWIFGGIIYFIFWLRSWCFCVQFRWYSRHSLDQPTFSVCILCACVISFVDSFVAVQLHHHLLVFVVFCVYSEFDHHQCRHIVRMVCWNFILFIHSFSISH